MQRVAMLSVHTSPLAQPGTRRRWRDERLRPRPRRPRWRVRASRSTCSRAPSTPSNRRSSRSSPASACCTCPPGRARRCRCATLPDLVGEFTDAARATCSTAPATYDVLHANYWVSGAVGHRLKHELDLPLVTTFHTLDRVKAEVGLGERCPLRPRIEAEVVRCADLVVASTRRGARPARAPLRRRPRAHRDHHARRRPHRVLSRRPRRRRADALGLADGPVLLFVGRIQPLKGADLAVRALAEVHDRTRAARVVGGPSGPDGEAEVARAARAGRRARARAPGALRRAAAARRSSSTTTAPPTCAWSRRAPSRSGWSRSRPPRAARRSSPPTSAGCGSSSTTASPATSSTTATRATYARADRPRARDDDCGADAARSAYARSTRYAWSIAAARLRRHYDDLAAREPGQVQLDPERRSTQAHELVATHLEGPVAAESYIQARRVRPRAAPLVRALHVRRARRDDDLLRPARAHAALRGVLPADPARAPPRALRVPAASATTRCTAPASRSVPTATCTSSVASRSSTSRSRSSTASSACSTSSPSGGSSPSCSSRTVGAAARTSTLRDACASRNVSCRAPDPTGPVRVAGPRCRTAAPFGEVRSGTERSSGSAHSTRRGPGRLASDARGHG